MVAPRSARGVRESSCRVEMRSCGAAQQRQWSQWSKQSRLACPVAGAVGGAADGQRASAATRPPEQPVRVGLHLSPPLVQHPRPIRPSVLTTSPSAVVDSPLLNKYIKDCVTWQDLACVLSKYGEHFNFIHVASALTHLAQLKGIATDSATKTFRASSPCMLSAAGVASLAIASEASWPKCYVEGDHHQTSAAISSPSGPPSPDAAGERSLSVVHPPACSPDFLALMDRLIAMTMSCMHQFGARQATNSVWALAQLHPHPGCAPLLAEMLPHMRSLLPWCEPQHLANSIWAVAKVGIIPSDDWVEDFLVMSERALPGFLPQHLGNTMWALARLGIAPDATWMDAFLTQLDRSTAQLAPIDVSHVLHGLASLSFDPRQHAHTELLLRVSHRLLPSSIQASSLGSSKDGQAAVAPRAKAGALAHKRGPASPQAIANTMWALATLSLPPTRAWMDQVFNEVEARLHEFEPQALSSLLWSAANLGQSLPPLLMQQIYCDSQPHLASFPPRSLSNIIWAVAACQQPSSSLSATTSLTSSSSGVGGSIMPPKSWVSAFLSAFQAQLPGCSDQATSNVMWALARLSITPEPHLVSAIILHLQALEAAKPGPEPAVSGQALANCLWAIAKLGFGLSDRAAEVLVAMVRRHLLHLLQPDTAGALATPLNSSELASVLYSFAKMKHCPPTDVTDLLLKALGMHLSLPPRALGPPSEAALMPAAQVPCALRAQDLSNMIWAVGALGLTPSAEWLSDFWSCCCLQLPAFNTKDLAQLTYSLAKIGWRPSQVLQPSASSDATANEQQQQQQQQQPRPQQRVTDLISAEAVLAMSWPDAAAAGRQPGDPEPVSRSRKATQAEPVGQVPQAWPGLDLLLSEASQAFGLCNSQDVANLSWGLAQMGVRPSQAWCRGLADVLVRRSEQLQGSHLATSLWALGRMGFRPEARSLLAVEGSLFRRMPALKPRELSACAWAFAAMGYTPDLQWLEAFSEQCMLTAVEFTQQDWSVVVYSLASIAEQEQDAVIYLEDLFISPQLEAQLSKFSPSTLAMLTYACGILGTRSSRLLGRLMSAAQPHLDQFKAHELSAMVCTAARLEYVPDNRFVSGWLATFEARMVTMHGPVLAACAWALAKMGIEPQPEFQCTFSRVLAERLPELSAKEVAMVVWALGEWATPLDAKLVASLGRCVGAFQPEYNRVVRRNLTWAMMKLKTKSKAADRQKQRKGFSRTSQTA